MLRKVICVLKVNQVCVRSLTTNPDSKYDGPSYQDVQSIRQRNLGPLVRLTAYKNPPLLHKGDMQWLYDNNGKRYLDLFAGIVTVSVGHCHPKVNEAINNQTNKLWHTTNMYLNPKVHEYADRLAAKMPGNLKSVFCVNSGSEANDLAMLLARLHTGNFDILSLRSCYHGMSPYTMGLTAYSSWRYPLPGVNSGIVHVTNPDPFRGRWGGNKCRDSPVQAKRKCDCIPNTCTAKDEYFQELQDVFTYSLPAKKCAAMFAESIQGVGGAIQFPKGYIKQAAELVRENGGLFVSDEVQSGFGRTGDHFWGFESHEIIPDIVTMAKGIGNGFPMGAVVTTPEIADNINRALHFNTFGGNPLASAVGLSVLDVIEEENLQQNCLNVGTYFMHGLAKLSDTYGIIGDVRGKGLMIGVEMVAAKDSMEPLSNEHFSNIWEDCKDNGVLLGRGGLHKNVFRIAPPMCLNKDNVDMTLEVFEHAVRRCQTALNKNV